MNERNASRVAGGPVPDPFDDERDGISRRRFLEVLSASFAAAGLAGCDLARPEEKVIPFLVQPEDMTPGVAHWYATSCLDCSAACGLLVKNRDGRPIKVEGSREHPLSLGGVCPRGQAAVLDLYDSNRLRGPLVEGREASWPELDAVVASELARVREKGGRIRLVTPTVASPTFSRAIAEFLAAFPGARHVVHDAWSASSILEAHRASHGERILPAYVFQKALAIVSLGADFLGTWISPVEFTKGWALHRKLLPGRFEMSWHVQFESRFSVTGAAADLRIPVWPSQERRVAWELARRIASALRPEAAPRLRELPGDPPVAAGTLDRIAAELVANRERSLVVSGSRDLTVQILVNFMNEALGNYGNTLDLLRPSFQKAGVESEVDELLEELARGEVDALLVHEANPAYDHPRGEEFREAAAKVPLRVSLSGSKDETTDLFPVHAPDHHFLESWLDARPHLGVHALVQPLVRPLFQTRSAVESLLSWAGKPRKAYDYLRQYWQDNVFLRQEREKDFEAFWTRALHDGVVVLAGESRSRPDFSIRCLDLLQDPVPVPREGFEIDVHPSHALLDGGHANNPWLQELPDPITKVAWGNVAALSPGTAAGLGVVTGRVLRLSAGDAEAELPALVQPGMPDGVVAVATGYGRTHAGPVAGNFPTEKMFPVEFEPGGGGNVWPFLGAGRVAIEPIDRMERLARTQSHDSQIDPLLGHDRRHVRQTTFAAWAADPAAGNEPPPPAKNLWPGHEYPREKWEMAIDLNSCTGCSACLVACQAENNVPVVGKAEIAKNREMHWLRIDRYYDETSGSGAGAPEALLQPMLCQHCDNAPCETVCPVLATLHSTDGLSMQVYNRCVGTRYCANNCPYKVRRFNWFDYAHGDLIQNLSLNPDIAVRTRGIMEKCSFCAQRIYDARAVAKGEGRPIADGEVEPACARSCPADAIVFGDANDPTSKVSQLKKDPRAYSVLAELGVAPSVRYLTRVRNRKV